MPRPRDPNVEWKYEYCWRCGGETEWRKHKAGLDRQGEQKWKWRCARCHSAGKS